MGHCVARTYVHGGGMSSFDRPLRHMCVPVLHDY
jgi:hypothetical protein